MPVAAATSPPRYNVLGVGVCALTLAQARDLVVAQHGAMRRGYICVTTVHGVMEAHDDPELRRIYNEAWLVTPDGMPLVWLGPHGVERVYGPDLMLTVCDAGRAVGLTHYFYGGAPGVADELRANLTARFPGLSVVGTFTPPFRALEAAELGTLQADLRAKRPDVMWIGLGAPKQERFMAQHWGHLDAGVLVGVGAAFDFHAGRTPQAPRWIQRSGFEWLFRMATEPRRLSGRYLRHNPRFVWHALQQRLGWRKYPLILPPSAG
jgi:N-acetylglucosaminyldiphosphoundecaprenol N-acetyl-beta-D-mannosaminyltransferase